MSLYCSASEIVRVCDNSILKKLLRDFLKNFWRTAVEFCMFMLEGVNRSWQPLPRETHSSCMSVVWAGHKNYVFLTLDMCRPAGGHTYSILGPKAAKANWLPFPAPKVFSEIAATNFEEQRPNHHAADRAKRLTDAIAVLMRDISMDPVSCERRPAMEKKTGNLVTHCCLFWHTRFGQRRGIQC